MKVVIVSGSVRADRQSHKVALYLNKLLVEMGVEADLIDFKESSLPLFGTDAPYLGKTRDAISLKLHQADALVLVTPEYHGSFSGALKNGLDYFWEEFKKKPIGVAAVSAGRMAGINASNQLQQVIPALGGYALPLKLLVSEIQTAFDSSLNPLRESIATSARNFLKELLWLAEALKEKKERDEQKSHKRSAYQLYKI